MTSFEAKVSDFIGHNQLLDKSKRYLVALSGGADSVCLLIVLQRLGYEIEAAHCNFHSSASRFAKPKTSRFIECISTRSRMQVCTMSVLRWQRGNCVIITFINYCKPLVYRVFVSAIIVTTLLRRFS